MPAAGGWGDTRGLLSRKTIYRRRSWTYASLAVKLPKMRLILTAALAGAISAPGAGDPEAAALRHYLSSMSWPVRASVLRAGSVSSAIDGWITAGDPPFLGEI